MENGLKNFFFIFFTFCFIFLVHAGMAQAVEIPEISSIEGEKVSIIGTSQEGTEVLIYFNGSFVGMAESGDLDNKTDNKKNGFYYNHPEFLTGGVFKIMAIARDKTSLVLSPPSEEFEINLGPLPAPVITEPNKSLIISEIKPLIKGLTVNNTFVKIFIDDIYYGKTEEVSRESGTTNFVYEPFLDLAIGEHTAWAVAENKFGAKSPKSRIINFKIEHPMPAPTLFKPVFNQNTAANQPFVVGLAKNDSKIKVYLDDNYEGEFTVENYFSGTSNFAYKPQKPLTGGQHSVYTTATDKRGKESRTSNVVYFFVREPSIAKSASEENKGAVAEIKQAEGIARETAIISAEEGRVETEEQEEPESKTGIILTGENETERPEEYREGVINEDKKNQNKLSFNLAIFLFFLLGIVSWIFWVNKELIKERRAESEKQDKEKDDKLL